MIIYYEAKTNLAEYILYDFTLEKPNGDTIVISWDEADFSQPENGLTYGRMKGVWLADINIDDYANGRVEEFKNCKVVDISLADTFGGEIITLNENKDIKFNFTRLNIVDNKNTLVLEFGGNVNE